MAEDSLEGDARPTDRAAATRVRRRDESPCFAFSDLCLFTGGQRAYCSVPRNRGPNTTLLSCMSVEGMGASLVVEGATNRDVFEV